MKRIAIIGGGISGLTTAYRLSQSHLFKEGRLQIHVYEKKGEFGGVIQSVEREGLLMEKGPDAFISVKPWAVQLCRELGLENEFIQTNAEVRKSFILSKNKLIPVPKGFYLMAPTNLWEAAQTPLLSFWGKIRMALEFFVPAKKDGKDESLASFVRRRFGKELLEKIAQPMIAGIYSADPEELSLEATFPHFLAMEQEHGSVIRGLALKKDHAIKTASGPRYSMFLSLKGGLHSLIESMISEMPGVHFHKETGVKKVIKRRAWEITFEDEASESFDLVCLAIQAPLAANLLREAGRSMKEQLKKITYENVATLNMVFNRGDIHHALNGLGYVVPEIEKKYIVGCTFSSVKFPEKGVCSNKVLLRAFVGGKASRGLLQLKDSEIIRTVCREVQQQLSITAEPNSTMLSRWPQSIPQYKVGHKQRVQSLFKSVSEVRGLYLTGNAYGGPGLPDCIRHATEVAQQMMAAAEITRKDVPECLASASS